MTATAPRTREIPQNPMSREEVQQMLRDAAFVLHMTRRVRCELEAGRPEATRSAATRPAELAAELGV